jgi:uncharacterized metal-binding protein YceD (DUF177 family)
MSSRTPEFSRLVMLSQICAEPFRRCIEASDEEREQLSRRFDLITLDRLVAKVELRRLSAELVLLEVEFEAEFEQCCTVTLEPVPGAVCERFSLVYGPAPEAEREITVSDDEPAFEPLDGESIDIGEAVAQELSLSLPVFPRDPEAVVDVTPDPFEGPFTSLARLRRDTEC